MIDIKEKYMCDGCHACYSVCPKDAINMEIDDEGFWYPKVDNTKCVDCNKCEKVCPILNKTEVKSLKKAYACYNLDEDIRVKSSSGGIFTILASEIIKDDGVVFGAKFDKDFNVVHDYVEDIDGLSKFRGSKYVQSNIGDSFRQAKKFLDGGRKVLFCGTPCQIGGLKSYLNKDYDNLVTVDLICHGVPSPMIWKRYINELGDGKKLSAMTFRDKSKGWNSGVLKYRFEDGSEINEEYGESLYIKGFIKNCFLRSSCYSCNFKTLDRGSDFTLGDFWGIEEIIPEIDKKSGVSLIMIHTKKAQDLFNGLNKNMYYEEVDINKSIVFNTCAIESVKNEKREDFFRILKDNTLEESIDKTIVEEEHKVGWVSRVKGKIKQPLLHCYNNLYDLYIELSYRKYELTNILVKKINIMTIDESIEYLIKNKCSLSRFGDGEMKLILGNRISFQKYDSKLSKRLKEVLQSNEENHRVGLPNVFKSLRKYDEKAARYWKRHIWKYGHLWFELTDKNKRYINSFISRCYMIFIKKDKCEKQFKNIKQLWNNKDLVIIEGEQSRLGIGNDLFENTKSISRILGPKRDAFDVYDKLLNYVKENVSKEKLILLALGPTATVLAYDLYKLGYHAVDIGHIDIEYEWFLSNAKDKIAIKNKYVGEAKGGMDVEDLDLEYYKKQIIAKIID